MFPKFRYFERKNTFYTDFWEGKLPVREIPEEKRQSWKYNTVTDLKTLTYIAAHSKALVRDWSLGNNLDPLYFLYYSPT